MRRWPLAAVLDLAVRGQAGAARELAVALAIEARLEEQREAAAAELRAHLAPGSPSATVPNGSAPAMALQTSAHHLGSLARHCARIGEELRAVEERIAHSRREVQARLSALAAARARTRALEAQRGRWRAARLRERERADEAANDELVSARSRAEP